MDVRNLFIAIALCAAMAVLGVILASMAFRTAETAAVGAAPLSHWSSVFSVARRRVLWLLPLSPSKVMVSINCLRDRPNSTVVTNQEDVRRRL